MHRESPGVDPNETDAYPATQSATAPRAAPGEPGPGGSPRELADEGGASGWLVAAAVLLFIAAALIGLISLFFVLFRSIFGEVAPGVWSDLGVPEATGAAAMEAGMTILLVIGVIGLLVAAAHVAAGIGILGRRGWARITGIVIAALGVLVFLLFSLGAAASMNAPVPPGALPSGMSAEEYRRVIDASAPVAIGIPVAGALTYLFVLAVLAWRGREFRRR